MREAKKKKKWQISYINVEINETLTNDVVVVLNNWAQVNPQTTYKFRRLYYNIIHSALPFITFSSLLPLTTNLTLLQIVTLSRRTVELLKQNLYFDRISFNISALLCVVIVTDLGQRLKSA